MLSWIHLYHPCHRRVDPQAHTHTPVHPRILIKWQNVNKAPTIYSCPFWTRKPLWINKKLSESWAKAENSKLRKINDEIWNCSGFFCRRCVFLLFPQHPSNPFSTPYCLLFFVVVVVVCCRFALVSFYFAYVRSCVDFSSSFTYIYYLCLLACLFVCFFLSFTPSFNRYCY